MWREEKKKRQEVEGENTIIKGIGNNSPEMKALQNRIKELENSLSIALENVSRYQQDLKIKDDEIGRLYNKIQR